jgi:hypothetical protein
MTFLAKTAMVLAPTLIDAILEEFDEPIRCRLEKRVFSAGTRGSRFFWVCILNDYKVGRAIAPTVAQVVSKHAPGSERLGRRAMARTRAR